jgi:predicted PurR-regulated permease PerM/CheY-like chemotaxis protein
LYFGRRILIPFVLAVLITFLLTPLVSGLERSKFPRALAVALTLIVAFSIAGGLIFMGTRQLSEILTRLPEYEDNIRRKIEAIGNPAGSGIAKAAHSIEQLTTALGPSSMAPEKQKEAQSTAKKKNAPGTQPPTPVPVQVVKPQPTVFDSLGQFGGSIIDVLATAAAVVILTLFMLATRRDLRNRLFRLFGKGRINVMTTALDDAAKRVSRYLLTQSLVNGTYAVLFGTGLHFIGVPYAPFWGVAAGLLRFIPYVGILIAGSCPFLLSLAVFQGWTKPLLVLALFATIEMTTAGLIEPWLYATRTGISSLAILLSAAFWTALWGPIGLVLSTPLTVCLVVLGHYLPQLEFLYILLGDEPVLTPEVAYYQRLLAMDKQEARQIAETFLKEKTLVELYDSVLIPALSLSEKDRHNDMLDEERQNFIYDTTKELIDELAPVTPPPDGSEAAVPAVPGVSALCVPARDRVDELVGLMLARVLRDSGYAIEAIGIGFVEEMLETIAKRHPDVLFISALPPLVVRHARALCKRAREQSPDLKIIVGVWHYVKEASKTAQARLGTSCADYIVETLSQAQVQFRLYAEQTRAAEHPEPAKDPAGVA